MTSTQIVILGRESAIAHSQKAYLDASGYQVDLIDLQQVELSSGFRARDIVIINIDYETLENYAVLGRLLQIETRPKLIIVLGDSDALAVDDDIQGGPAIVLSEPEGPDAIITAIEDLVRLEEKLLYL